MEVRSLRRALFPPSLLQNPSPANIQSTRLAVHVNEDGFSSSVFIASGCHAYKVEVGLEDSAVEKGKDSLLIPIPAKILSSSRVRRCPHRSEIQSLALADADCDMGLILGTVDSHGHLIVSRLSASEGDLSIWDLRVNKNGGCIQRVSGALGCPFYAVCSSADGIVAVGGVDRSVTVYDCRRWSALSRWANCSKYDITGLAFSSLSADHIYVQGVDYEVSCGNWKENRKVFSFRGDSNWLGFSKHSKTDTLAGWSDYGNIFLADIQYSDSSS